MNKQDIKSIEHFAYPLPTNMELRESELIPYRTNARLKRKIDYLFRHVKFEYNSLYIDVSTSGARTLTTDMSNIAVGATRYFLQNPQQFAHKLDNVTLQIIVKMWKQTFKHCKLQEKELDRYYATRMKLLGIDNGLVEELIRTVEEKDFIQHNDNMVKKRTTISPLTNKPVGLRDKVSYGTHEGSKTFEYLCSLE